MINLFRKKYKDTRLKYFNIAFYASIMGFGGLALATHKLEHVYNTNSNFYLYIVYFALIYFILVSIAYIAKMIINFEDVKNDFNHSVKSNFFPGIGKILLIFSIVFLNINIQIAEIFFLFGIVIQAGFTIIIFRRWILHETDIKTMNPLWFLPVVGNMIVPFSGISLGYTELSWFFFSVGLIMWAILFTVIMNRIIFHNPLAQKLMPTLFILIAPPSVAFISYTLLNDGKITNFGKMMYYFSLFMFIMILSKINILYKLKFFLSWWAYSFPMAVLTSATILFYSKTNYIFFYYLGIIFYIILILISIILIYKTIIGFKNKELCIEE